MSTEKPSGREMLATVLFALVFGAVFLSYNRSYHLPVYPGYFLLQTLALLLFGYYLFYAERGAFPAPPALFFWLAAFLSWAVLCSSWAAHRWIVADGLRRETTLVLSTLGLAHLLRIFPTLRRSMWTVVLFVLTVLAGLYGERVYRLDRLSRFGFPFANPNLAASILGFACVFALSRFLDYCRSRQIRRAVFHALVVLSLSLTIVLVCRSKGALLAMGVVIAFLFYRLFLHGRTLPVKLSVSAVSLAFFAVFITLKERELAALLAPTIEIRLFVWEGTWDMICHTPLRFLFGWGPGNFFANFPDFQDPRMFTAAYQAPVVLLPHNFFLEMWAQYGLVGLFLWGGIVAGTARAVRRLSRKAEPVDRIDARAVLAGFSFLILHAQVSVALSYPWVQWILALALAWTLSLQPWREIPWERTPAWTLRLYRIAVVLLMVVGLWLWKCCAWESLWFHVEYRTARKTYPAPRAEISGHFAQPPMFVGETAAALTAISPPTCENYHTCQWRNDTGRIVIESYPHHPEMIRRGLPIFSLLEKRMPLYGDFLLNCAILSARQSKVRQADAYFAQYARHNPFSLDLWIWWGLACRNRDATVARMLAITLEMQEQYGEDGALWLGEALARDLLRQREPARELMHRIHAWPGRGPRDDRAARIRSQAEFYLRRQPDSRD